MADTNADIIQSAGTEVATNPQAVNYTDGLDATESNGVVEVGVADDGVGAAKLVAGVDRFVAVATTNGTTAVSVFGASGLAHAITITGVYLVALDTTASNITVENPAGTAVCTIAKGATAGALVGAVTLADTTVAAGTNLVVDSSGAGNARVYITYTA
jgi:hypothetical protein